MWQTILGRCIYQSEFGHQVWQNYRYRWLTFSSPAIQSIIQRTHPERPVTDCIKAMRFPTMKNPGNTLHLGVGGASIAHALLPHRAHHEWVFVEVDAEVVTIAQKYFFLESLHPNKIFCQDAAQYMAKSTTNYKNIIIDISNAQCFPAQLVNVHFFLSIISRLQEGGIITLNLPDQSQHYIILNIVKLLLPAYFVFNIQALSNIVIVCGKYKNTKALFAHLQLDQYCSNIRWHSGWGAIAEIK